MNSNRIINGFIDSKVLYNKPVYVFLRNVVSPIYCCDRHAFLSNNVVSRMNEQVTLVAAATYFSSDFDKGQTKASEM